MPLTYWLACVGVVLTLIGFISYNTRTSKINTASWLLWVIGDALEAGTYLAMTDVDMLKNAVPITFAIGSTLTFFFALANGRFGMPDRTDRVVMGVDILISMGWWQKFYTAAAANIMLVATELLSFIPLYRGVLRGEEKEYVFPWLMWAAGDVMFLATVLSVAHTMEEMIYPIVQAVAHVLVVVCIWIRNVHDYCARR